MIDATDVLRLVISAAMPDSVVAQLVIHYLATAGSGGDEATILTALAANIEAALTDMQAMISTGVSTTEADLLKYDPVLHQFDGIENEALSGFTGGDVGHMLPHGDALLLKFYTTFPRRQGRKYIYGLGEANQQGGTWSAALLVAAALASADFMDTIVSDGITLVPGTFNVTPASDYYETFEAFVNAGGINSFCDYQRRRRPGVGI